MSEDMEAKKLFVTAQTHRRLKMYAAYTGKTITEIADKLINDGLDRETMPDFRHVAADSDHIAQPNEM